MTNQPSGSQADATELEDFIPRWNGSGIRAGGSCRFCIPIGVQNSGSAGSPASLLPPPRATLPRRGLEPECAELEHEAAVALANSLQAIRSNPARADLVLAAGTERTATVLLNAPC